jgi:hypothetical protein
MLDYFTLEDVTYKFYQNVSNALPTNTSLHPWGRFQLDRLQKPKITNV